MADLEVCSPTSALKQHPKLSRKLVSPSKNGQKSHSTDAATDAFAPFEEPRPVDYQQYHEEGMLTPIDWFPNTQLLYEQEFFSQARKGAFPSLDIEGSNVSRLDQLQSLLSTQSSPHKEFPSSPSLLKRPPRRRSAPPPLPPSTSPAPSANQTDSTDQTRRASATPTVTKGKKSPNKTIDKENQQQAAGNGLLPSSATPRKGEASDMTHNHEVSSLRSSMDFDMDMEEEDEEDEEAGSAKRKGAPGSKSGSAKGKKRTRKSSGKGRKGEGKSASRYDSSLGLLTKKFISLVRDADKGIVDLNKAAETLSVQKRRIYDITNVLEGIGLIEKKSKNNIQWKGQGIVSDEEKDKMEKLRDELDEMNQAELLLDDKIRQVQHSIRLMAEDHDNERLAYVTHEDLANLPCFQGETLIAIKAPSGTRLEVPDPDEGMEAGHRRYQIFLKSATGDAIDVYLVQTKPVPPPPPPQTPQKPARPQSQPHSPTTTSILSTLVPPHAALSGMEDTFAGDMGVAEKAPLAGDESESSQDAQQAQLQQLQQMQMQQLEEQQQQQWSGGMLPLLSSSLPNPLPSIMKLAPPIDYYLANNPVDESEGITDFFTEEDALATDVMAEGRAI